jgi:hypothetical protein
MGTMTRLKRGSILRRKRKMMCSKTRSMSKSESKIAMT